MEQELKAIVESEDGVNHLILIQNQAGMIMASGRLHPLTLHLLPRKLEVTCFSAITAKVPGQGYGKLVMNEIKRHVEETGQTAIGFCASDLLPFYRACNCQILQPEDNNFVYVDGNGQIIPNIVPGEVVYYSGRDKIIKKIFASSNKVVRIKLK